MKIILSLICLFVALFLNISLAQTTKEGLERVLPNNVKIESFKFNRDMGLYEVISEGKVFYLTEDLRYLIIGNVIDLRNMKNLTADRVREIRKIDFESLPKRDAIKITKGKRAVAVFTDPDCPYCKKLHIELAKLKNVSIFVFLYPVSDEGRKKSIQIWCSEDRARSLDEAMNGGQVSGNFCGDHPIERNLFLGKKLFITGTPTTITDKGEVINGYVRAEIIEEALNRGIK